MLRRIPLVPQTGGPLLFGSMAAAIAAMCLRRLDAWCSVSNVLPVLSQENGITAKLLFWGKKTLSGAKVLTALALSHIE
jgi:hypothetical protein